jgi:hypothetical protein
VFEADVRFYKEGDGRIVLEEFRRIQQASPTKAARLVAKLVDVALSEEPRWTAALDRYDVVDGEQVYLFTRDPYGVFYVIDAVDGRGGSDSGCVVALLFGNLVGYHGREWDLVRTRLRNLRKH